MDFETLRNYCLGKKGSAEGLPFGPDTLVFKVGTKIFAFISLDETPLRINLKGDPNDNDILRQQFPAIIPGYHMNKHHWNTVIIDGRLPDDLVYELVDQSYDLVYKSLSKKEMEQI